MPPRMADKKFAANNQIAQRADSIEDWLAALHGAMEDEDHVAVAVFAESIADLAKEIVEIVK